MWTNESFNSLVEVQEYSKLFTSRVTDEVIHVIEYSAYAALKNKYEELLSYLPKVPTKPYEKELAKQNKIMREALEKILMVTHGLNHEDLYAKEALEKCGSPGTTAGGKDE